MMNKLIRCSPNFYAPLDELARTIPCVSEILFQDKKRSTHEYEFYSDGESHSECPAETDWCTFAGEVVWLLVVGRGMKKWPVIIHKLPPERDFS